MLRWRGAGIDVAVAWCRRHAWCPQAEADARGSDVMLLDEGGLGGGDAMDEDRLDRCVCSVVRG